MIEIPSIVVTTVFHENNKYYPHVFSVECKFLVNAQHND